MTNTKTTTPRKMVRETAAGKAISVYYITPPNGLETHTLHVHYGSTGIVTLDLFKQGGGLIYQGRASGYGYDKFTAALSGAVVDGHVLRDHCEYLLKAGPDTVDKGAVLVGNTWVFLDNNPLKPVGFCGVNTGIFNKVTGEPVGKRSVTDEYGKWLAWEYRAGQYGDGDIVTDPIFYAFTEYRQESGLGYLRDLGYHVNQVL